MEDRFNAFSIKDLENFSGIKAHTIRIWEKRYNILEPDRTDSNIRTYNESELKKILNVSFLNRNGIKISNIARLDEDELTSRVMDISSKNEKNNGEFQPGKILASAIYFDELQFRDNIYSLINRYGLEQAYCRFINPLTEKAKILWQTGSLSRAQEQFVRTVINNILISEDIELNVTQDPKNQYVAMISTSENNSENSFLFYKYLLRKKGFGVIYTGGILPVSEVIEIYKTKPFQFLIVHSGRFEFAEKRISYFRNIGKSLMLKKIIIADSYTSSSVKTNEGLIFTSDPCEFLKAVESMKIFT